MQQKNKREIMYRIAQCHDCNWNIEYYDDKNITTKAKNHAKKLRHCVTIETGYSISYEGRKM